MAMDETTEGANRLKAAWIEVRTGVRRCLQEFELRAVREDAERLGGEQDENKKKTVASIAELKADVDLLCAHDPHQLMRRLESISHEHVMNMKLDLWPLLVTPEKQPALAKFYGPEGEPDSDERKFEQACLFLRALLDRFSTFQESIHYLSEIFAALDGGFLGLFGISWKVINHHIFDDIIYQEFTRKFYLPLNLKVFNIPALSAEDKDEKEETEEECNEETLEILKNRTEAKLKQSLKHLHKLMVNCRKIFSRAETRIRAYAERGILPEHPKERKRRLIAEDQAFFLSQRRMMRMLAERLRNETNSAMDQLNNYFEEHPNEEDDREFMNRLHELVDNGLSLVPVCPGFDDVGEKTKRVRCERCHQQHCYCDACIISHTIVCGLFTEEESNSLLIAGDQESTGSGDDGEDDEHSHSFTRMLAALGSNVFSVHSQITNDEHLANIHNDWEMADESGVEAGSNSDATSQKSSCSSEDVSSGSPVSVSPYASEKSDMEKKKKKTTKAKSSPAPPQPRLLPKKDGCAELNLQLEKDLAMVKSESCSHRPPVKCVPGTENVAVWCCLFHRNDFLRQIAHSLELKKLLEWDTAAIENPTKTENSLNMLEQLLNQRPKQHYRFAKLYPRIWLRRCKEEAPKMSLSEFTIRMECDRQRADIYKRALEIVGEKLAGQTRVFYKSAQSEMRRSVEERLMKEAAEACRIITERADNRQACNWSSVHDHIKAVRDWGEVQFGRSEKHLVCTLYEYEVAMLAGLPRRGLAFFLMRSLYHSSLGGRLRHFKVEVAATDMGTPICDKSYRCRCDITCTSRMEQSKLQPIYVNDDSEGPAPIPESDFTVVAELKARSRYEALWTSIVVSTTEILECPDLGRLIDLSYLIAEAIVLRYDECQEKNIPYDPVTHFKALCPIYNYLDDCGHIRKPRFSEVKEHEPNPNNPHMLSTKDMKSLEELGFPAFLVAELSPSEVSDILSDSAKFALEAHARLHEVSPSELRKLQETIIPQSVDYSSSIDEEDEPFPTRSHDIFGGPSNKILQLRVKLKQRREREAIEQNEKKQQPVTVEERVEMDPKLAEEEAERIAASLDASNNASSLAKALKRQRQKERKTAQKKAAEEEKKQKEEEERLKREEAERKKQEQKLAARQRMEEAKRQKELEEQKKRAAAAEAAKAKAKEKKKKTTSQPATTETFVVEEPDFGPVKQKVEPPQRQRTKSPELPPHQRLIEKPEEKLKKVEAKKNDSPKMNAIPKAAETASVGKATQRPPVTSTPPASQPIPSPQPSIQRIAMNTLENRGSSPALQTNGFSSSVFVRPTETFEPSRTTTSTQPCASRSIPTPITPSPSQISSSPNSRMQEILKVYGAEKLLEAVNQTIIRPLAPSLSAVDPPPGFGSRYRTGPQNGHSSSSFTHANLYGLSSTSLHGYPLPPSVVNASMRSNSPALQGSTYSQPRYSSSPLGDDWHTPLDRLATNTQRSTDNENTTHSIFGGLLGHSTPYTAPPVPRPSPGPIGRPKTSTPSSFLEKPPSTNVLYEDKKLFESATRSAWESAEIPLKASTSSISSAFRQPAASNHQLSFYKPNSAVEIDHSSQLFTSDINNLIPSSIYDDDN